jgi:hypothetical protein
MARPMGTLSTTPPSMKISPSMSTGGRSAGSAAEAWIRSTAGPSENHRIRPSVSEVATTSRGIGLSSRRSKSMPSSMILRMPKLGWTDSRCWKNRQGVGNRPWGNTSSRVTLRHRSANLSTPAAVGWPQYPAALIAPTEAP